MTQYYNQVCSILQGDIEKGLEMKKLVLSGFLASEEIYINQLEALLLVRHTHSLTSIFMRTLIYLMHSLAQGWQLIFPRGHPYVVKCSGRL